MSELASISCVERRAALDAELRRLGDEHAQVIRDLGVQLGEATSALKAATGVNASKCEQAVRDVQAKLGAAHAEHGAARGTAEATVERKRRALSKSIVEELHAGLSKVLRGRPESVRLGAADASQFAALWKRANERSTHEVGGELYALHLAVPFFDQLIAKNPSAVHLAALNYAHRTSPACFGLLQAIAHGNAEHLDRALYDLEAAVQADAESVPKSDARAIEVSKARYAAWRSKALHRDVVLAFADLDIGPKGASKAPFMIAREGETAELHKFRELGLE
jgi:hypothetical protein